MKRIRIITGHFGSGKSELSVNMVTALKKEHDNVAIVDLDIANPYFRSRERQAEMERLGIKVYHNSFGYDISQDLPALSAAIKEPLIDKEVLTVVDAGGDDSGARVLNQFREYFLDDEEAEMLFVLNANRPETATLEGCLDHLDRIQVETGLQIKGIINNTHLLSETSAEDIKKGYKLAKEVSETLDIPVIASYCNRKILNNIKEEDLDGIEQEGQKEALEPLPQSDW